MPEVVCNHAKEILDFLFDFLATPAGICLLAGFSAAILLHRFAPDKYQHVKAGVVGAGLGGAIAAAAVAGAYAAMAPIAIPAGAIIGFWSAVTAARMG